MFCWGFGRCLLRAGMRCSRITPEARCPADSGCSRTTAWRGNSTEAEVRIRAEGPASSIPRARPLKPRCRARMRPRAPWRRSLRRCRWRRSARTVSPRPRRSRSKCPPACRPPAAGLAPLRRIGAVDHALAAIDAPRAALVEKGPHVVEGEDVGDRILSVELLSKAAARRRKGLRIFVRDGAPLPSIAERITERGEGETSLVVMLGHEGRRSRAEAVGPLSRDGRARRRAEGGGGGIVTALRACGVLGCRVRLGIWTRSI